MYMYNIHVHVHECVLLEVTLNIPKYIPIGGGINCNHVSSKKWSVIKYLTHT